MDVDMDMKAESSGSGEAPPGPPAALPHHYHHHHHHHHHHQQGHVEGHGLNVRGLLALARQLLNEGKPSLALQAVVAAMKAKGGEMAVFETLHRARELYQNKLQASVATDELASLFARCVIDEVEPSRPELLLFFNSSGTTMVPNLEGASILSESGRKDIVVDAFMDGSSFVCLQCGGLVSNLRKDEHLAYWCSEKR